MTARDLLANSELANLAHAKKAEFEKAEKDAKKAEFEKESRLIWMVDAYRRLTLQDLKDDNIGTAELLKILFPSNVPYSELEKLGSLLHKNASTDNRVSNRGCQFKESEQKAPVSPSGHNTNKTLPEFLSDWWPDVAQASLEKAAFMLNQNQVGKKRTSCKNGSKCWTEACPFGHPPTRKRPCLWGQGCTKKNCSFAHPQSSRSCRYGATCTKQNCRFDHPKTAKSTRDQAWA